jgi:hypothetical protein
MSIFSNGGYEFYEYEILSLVNGVYVHNGFITDYISTANVSFDFSRNVVGGASFSIRNHAELNYLTDLIKVWYNLTTNGVNYRYPIGVYMLSTPAKKYDGKLYSRDIQAFDLLLALEQDTTITSQSFSAGTNVVTAVTALINSVGTWVNLNIEPCTDVLGEDVSYELGKSKLFIINSLLNMINYYPLWCTGNGVYKSIPWVDNYNVAYEFLDDNESLYESDLSINIDYSDIYNRVVIINNQLQSDTPPLYKVWTLEDEDLASHPFSYTSIGRYVTKKFDSDAVSQGYVDLRARRETLKMLELEESIDYRHAFVSCREDDGLPWHGDCYRFRNNVLGVDSLYLINSQRIDLKTGTTVQSVIKRVRSF